jgi:hypothetical protein
MSFLLSLLFGLAAAVPGGDEAAALARKTLAQKLGLAEDRILVEETLAVEWPNAGLGCPQKGMVYAQVVTPGHRVRLRVGDRTYDVHVGHGRAVVCAGKGRGEAREAPGGAVADPYVVAAVRVSEAARAHLARRLKLAEKDVEVRFLKPTTWPDAGLGCSPPGETHDPKATPGFVIQLEAKGKAYRYHAATTRVVPCDPR